MPKTYTNETYLNKTYTGLILLTATLMAACSQSTPAPVVAGFQMQEESAKSIYTPGTDLEEEFSTHGTQTLYHVVKRGDTLWDIAQMYNTTTNEIIDANNLDNSILRVGQQLKVKNVVDKPANQTATSQERKSFTERITEKKSNQHKRLNTQKAKTPEIKKTEPKKAQNKTEQKVGERLHRVRKGENLFRIGLKYNVSPLDIMAVNDINKPENLQAGAVITVPVVSETKGAEGTQKERSVNKKLARQRGFVWPVKGKVVGDFGREGEGIVNNGIKINVPENTSVHAAEDGKVIYADDGLQTYGNLILLRHKNGLITAYAHVNDMQVSKGAEVKKGEVIARAGQSGEVSKTQLHFEVRRNARAIDPLKVLPKG